MRYFWIIAHLITFCTMRTLFHTNFLLRHLLVGLCIFVGLESAIAQFDGIGLRAGINATKPADRPDGKPFLISTGWNASASAVWDLGPHSTLSAGISLSRLNYTETLTVAWPSDWPLNGEFTNYENTSRFYDTGCTVLWSRHISKRPNRLSPTLGFTASKLLGTGVSTLRTSGRGDDITLDYYQFPAYNLSGLLGLQWEFAAWQRHSLSIMPLYSYALASVKSTGPGDITTTYRPHFFSIQLAYQHKTK